MYKDMYFEWDVAKEQINILKHQVSFEKAREVFLDPYLVIMDDIKHSQYEKRHFAFGKVDGVVMTVRFIYRLQSIRIFGAGYWRQGKKHYETENTLH